MSQPTIDWTLETDVLVVGYGAAGAVAAINAHDQGARVMLLEKMKNPGGCSILAGGALKAAADLEQAIAYLTATQGGRVAENLIRTFAKGLVELPQYMENLAQLNSSTISRRPKTAPDGLYPFPGAETFFTVLVQEIPGFQGYPWASTGGNLNGQRLIKLLADHVDSRRIPVYLETPVTSLVTDPEGRVIGARAVHQGTAITIRAKQAVILASGGFEFNEKLKREYLEAIPVYSMGNPGNTGDGILMAQKAGAALWHMWHIHGSYGFKVPGIEPGIRVSIGGARNPERKVAWILVDQRGQRFMNEYHPAPQDTMHRPLEFFDPDLPGYPRIPAYLIFDEDGRKLGRIANPLTAHPDHRYQWSADNRAEVEQGWIKRAANLEELAGWFDLPADALRRTIERWNEAVAAGADPDFRRPPGTIVPIRKPPFYIIPVWPICTNTQGGPEHNEKQQVVDPYGQPIPGLYAAGELGSFFGHLYLLGGNLSECVISGRIAGREAAGEPEKNDNIPK
jgi:succinate dehydrogenase/fumarate reductase flavoprotein subunit